MFSDDHYIAFEKNNKLKENKVLPERVTLKSLGNVPKAGKMKKVKTMVKQGIYFNVDNPANHRKKNRKYRMEKFLGSAEKVTPNKFKIKKSNNF